MNLTFRFWALLAAVLIDTHSAQSAAIAENRATEISFTSLVQDMTNREALARFPSPQFRLRDQSSYDRLSTTPDDPKTWFANRDLGNFLRVEENSGRKEWVLLDHQKPGAIVRSWMADKRIEPGPKKGTVRTILRIYLDGAEQPVIEGHMHDLFNGTLLAPYPFGHKSLSSAVSFLPIPYARRCKITTDEPPMYYIFDYREYPDSTPVKTFTKQDLESARSLLDRVGTTMSNPPDPATPHRIILNQQLKAQTDAFMSLPAGRGAVRSLSLKLNAKDSPQTTRSLVLKMEFDGQETVWCPVGDFFGTGVGVNPFQDWYRTVDKNGAMTCRWVMPYSKSGRITLANLGKVPIYALLEASVGDWTWDDRSMFFHATWRREYPLKTLPHSDWNYVTLQGRGVYVGDTLTVWNPVPQWWGEGDAKIYLDGERFPSLFGTGTEDYYGYSWGGRNRGFYQHPFHTQVRVGPYNQINPTKPSPVQATQGYSTETRTRALDAMPFGQSLRLDMEVWHWKECEMDYAVCTYWYGRPGTADNHVPMPEMAAQPVAEAQTNPLTRYQFAFGPGKMPARFTQVTPDLIYSKERSFGFEPGADLKARGADLSRGNVSSDKPFFFSVALPEGNYKVTITFGDAQAETDNTVKAELRRLMVEHVRTQPGKFETHSFIVNVRSPAISTGGEVRLGTRERTSEAWAWDDRLSLEFNGAHPGVAALEIERAEVPTVYLLGDSTVCDQAREPYNSWGQMLTRFLKPDVAVCNGAESGDSIAPALRARRFDKFWSQMRRGDYLFIQFGHNDMKSTATNALEIYAGNLRRAVDETRKHSGIPVLITSVSRRTFNDQGRITNSFKGYTQAVREVAREKNAPLIDLQNLTAAFYEALGPEKSHQAFATPSEGTHHNNYGSYEIAKCVVVGIKQNQLDLAKHIAADFTDFDPSHPDPVEEFKVPKSPQMTTLTPLGN